MCALLPLCYKTKLAASKLNDLPITALLPEVIAQLPGQKLVLQAPPGAGKSTALPLALLRAESWQGQRIVLLQPRRLAAISIAHYLAQQLGEAVGEQVGYHVRGEQRSSSSTRLLIVTEGTFTQYLQQDPELTGIGAVLFDEFHERNLFSDLSLAMLLEALPLRPDLGLLIMSATLPAEQIAQWLGDAKVLVSEGRQHPITMHYRAVPPRSEWLPHTATVVREAVQLAEHGVLVFLPGWREITHLAKTLDLGANIHVQPLHRQLTLAEQQAALQALPSGQKKVVLATNIAETSVTIPGIDVVVDSGRERRATFYPRHGLTRLATERISKAAATQRAGRAGRLGPGHCFRIWAEGDTQGLRDFDAPAVETEDLAGLVLEAKRWGSEVKDLKFLSSPNSVHLEVGEHLLKQLGVLDERGHLTKVGQQVAALGNEPRIARIAVAAQDLDEYARSKAALLLAQLEYPAAQQHLPLTAQQLGKQARQRWQWWQRKLGGREQVNDISVEEVATLALWGYPDRVALGRSASRSASRNANHRSSSDSYLVAYGGGAQFHGQDTRNGDALILILSMRLSERSADAIIDDFVALDRSQLDHPALDLHWQTELAWQGPQQRLQAVERQRLGAIVLAERPAQQQPSAAARVQLLVELVQRQHDLLENLLTADEVQQFLARVNLARQHLGAGQAWPDFHVEALRQELESWAAPYWQSLQSLAELQRWSPLAALQARLDYAQQQQLARLCPTHWQAPSGLRHRIDYQSELPTVALKLQEVFGEPVSPTICQNQVTLVLELLSPARRPLQRTADLASFWQNAYQQVKKEMKGRYPKHPWPDDPLQAQATQKTKRMLKQ
ncbi:ATP-dependent helicase HrpB [Pseudidiomarina homiensis]|uniref:ATP-dependent helicase HrpB n=1 Tax=Pseudidiomarina homiensis TaxID=364198 RepID=A0A432XUY3_9GAMM|nr:ATP-dependent helicase HrpB [Pseudidiomarina homiensis]